MSGGKPDVGENKGATATAAMSRLFGTSFANFKPWHPGCGHPEFKETPIVQAMIC